MEKPAIKKNERLTRGVTAKLLGVDPETLRYYESQKLINPPQRMTNNYRIYNNNDVAIIKFILQAKELGFSLKEIKELLGLTTSNVNSKKARTIVMQKVEEINMKIKRLKYLKTILERLSHDCINNKNADICPIVNYLHGTWNLK